MGMSSSVTSVQHSINAQMYINKHTHKLFLRAQPECEEGAGPVLPHG